MKKQKKTLKMLSNTFLLEEFLNLVEFDVIRVHMPDFSLDDPLEYCYFLIGNKESKYGSGFYIFDGYEKRYKEDPEHLFDLNSKVKITSENKLRIMNEDKVSDEICELEFFKLCSINLKEV
jgi:hypothetical protein